MSDYTIEIRDRFGTVIFVGAIDVTRGDEYLAITHRLSEPATLRCAASQAI